LASVHTQLVFHSFRRAQELLCFPGLIQALPISPLSPSTLSLSTINPRFTWPCPSRFSTSRFSASSPLPRAWRGTKARQHLKEQHVRPRANMMGCDARHRGVRPREKWRTGDAPTGTTGRHAGSPNGRDPGKGSTRWFLPKKKKNDLGFAASQLPHLGRSWSVLPKPPPPVLPSLPAVWDA
jgi:hypothetical protein